jgi:hypothetical protein
VRPSYLVRIYLVSPWYTLSSCPRLPRVWMNCLPIYVKYSGSINVVLMPKSLVLR